MAEALNSPGRKRAIAVAIIALLLGCAAGILHLYMRFVNNTQGEMFDGAGHVDLAYSTLLFFAAFIPIFGGVAVCGAIILLLSRVFRSRRDRAK